MRNNVKRNNVKGQSSLPITLSPKCSNFVKIFFLSAKSHMHIFNMLIISVQSFKLIALKLREQSITQTCYPILKPNLKIVYVQNAVILSKIIFLPAKCPMHIFNVLITSVQSFKLIA